MKRHLTILLALIGVMVMCGGCRQTPSLEEYWSEVTPEWVMADVAAAESHFTEWTERLAKAPKEQQHRSVDSLVELMCKDEVCAYIYFEWSVNVLYGLWSPTRNEETFGYLLQRINEEPVLESIRSAETRRLGELLQHNRVGSSAKDFVLYDSCGNESTLGEIREEKPLLLLVVDITCPSCIDIIAEVESQQPIMEAAQRGEVRLLAVAVGSHPMQLESFAKEHEGSLWQVRGASRGALEGAYYDANASPCLWLIGEQGTVEVGITRQMEAISDCLTR